MGFNLTLTQIHIHLVGPQSCLVNHIFPKLNWQNPRSWTIMKPYWWYTYPSEKYKFVTWDYDIPNIWKIKFKFQTTNQHITCVLGWTPCCSLETHALNRPSIQPHPTWTGYRLGSWGNTWRKPTPNFCDTQEQQQTTNIMRCLVRFATQTCFPTVMAIYQL